MDTKGRMADMAMQLRIVHYLDQFFAGMGGDEKAGMGPSVIKGAVGPGRLLQRLLGDKGQVVATFICGDNFISGMPGFDETHLKQAMDVFRNALEEHKADVVVAGPAFLETRYGIGCGEVCQAAQAKGVPAIAAMHPENGAVALYVRDVYIMPTGDSAREMPAIMPELARLALKLGEQGKLGSPEEDGYIPRGG